MANVKDAPRTEREAATAPAPAKVAGTPATVPATRHVTPRDRMRRLAAELDRVFDEFGVNYGRRIPGSLTRAHELLRRESGLIPADWSPRVDVIESDGKFLVRADLPGLSREDIQVEVTDDLLTIRGERKQESGESREGYSYSECSYGSFYRAIPLPEGADAAGATAVFREGVLEIAIPSPSRHEPQPRRIEVRAKP